LKTSLSQEERQAAYWIFERLALMDHYHQVVEEDMAESLRWILGRARELVQEFTSVKDIEKARLERKQLEAIATQAVSTALLVAAALGSVLPVTGFPTLLAGQAGIAVKTAETVVGRGSAALNLVASSYIGITGLVTKARDNR
jgi:hypothetical protein